MASDSKKMHLLANTIEQDYDVDSRLSLTQFKYNLAKHPSFRRFGERDRQSLILLLEYAYRGFILKDKNAGFLTGKAWDVYQKQTQTIEDGVTKTSEKDRERYHLLKKAEIVYILSVDKFLLEHERKQEQQTHCETLHTPMPIFKPMPISTPSTATAVKNELPDWYKTPEPSTEDLPF